MVKENLPGTVVWGEAVAVIAAASLHPGEG